MSEPAHWVHVRVIPSTLFHTWGVIDGAVVYADLRNLPESLAGLPKGDLCITQYVGRRVACSCGLVTLTGIAE